MNNGVLCFANNNGRINYIKQAEFLATRVKKYLGLPTSLVTSTPQDVSNKKLFDKIIEIQDKNKNTKRYYNGTEHESLLFKNNDRCNSYAYSPYTKTLVLDTDVIICNDSLKHAFTNNHSFQIYSNCVDLTTWRHHPEFDYINDKGIEFYWATAFCFTKDDISERFFVMLNYVVENYKHFSNVYDLGTRNFRNDHAFSIAIHVLNGFLENDWIKKLPGSLYYTLDRDHITNISNDKLTFLLQKEKCHGEYTLASTKGMNVHVMNKFSLEEIIK